MLLLMALPVGAKDRFITVTFHSVPEGATISAFNSARTPAYLGVTGQPVRLDTEWLRKGSAIEVKFELPGYASYSDTVYSLTLQDGGHWPAPDSGKVVHLKPASMWTAAKANLPPLVGVFFLALGLFKWRQKRTIAVATRKAESEAWEAATAAAQADQAPTFPSGYVLHHELGRGGMAVVYEVTCQETGEPRALKMLNPELSDDPDALKRLRREIKIWRDLVHPCIVPLYDFGECNGRYYLVMERIHGETLRDYMHRERMETSLALEYAEAMLDAVAYAHKKDIVHRDLKPENIMIREDGRLLVLDFGLSRTLNEKTAITMNETVMGTPAYMAPERFSGVADASSDQYALGLIIYELLAGRHAISNTVDLAGILFCQLYEEPASLRQFCPDLPEAVEDVIMKMIAKDSKDRFPDVGVARQALVEAAGLVLQEA